MFEVAENLPGGATPALTVDVTETAVPIDKPEGVLSEISENTETSPYASSSSTRWEAANCCAAAFKSGSSGKSLSFRMSCEGLPFLRRRHSCKSSWAFRRRASTGVLHQLCGTTLRKWASGSRHPRLMSTRLNRLRIGVSIFSGRSIRIYKFWRANQTFVLSMPPGDSRDTVGDRLVTGSGV